MTEKIDKIKERIMSRNLISIDESATNFVDTFDLPKGKSGPVLHIKCPEFHQVGIVRNICTLRIYLANRDNIEIDPKTKIHIFVNKLKIDDIRYEDLKAYKIDEKGKIIYKIDEKEMYRFEDSPYKTIILTNNRRLIIYVMNPNLDIDKEFVRLSLDITIKEY